MPLLAFTIFLGAFLLFQVEPLIARYVLPWFGGGPAVWTTCMLFFQFALLAGYAYAHLLNRVLSPRRQVLCHVLVLAGSLLFLPIAIDKMWKPAGDEAAGIYILAMLAASIGAPFFALSATGPLLQSWFTRSMPRRAVYRLYGLSNAGSFLALLTYPFVFEPHMTLLAQSRAWSYGYGVFAACCVGCGVAFWRWWGLHGQAGAGAVNAADAAQPGGDGPSSDESKGLSPAPSWFDVARWAGLACLGSVMLLATTNQVCQDVAVVPFLWVLPLSLYLLTFMICFDRPEWYSRGWWALILVVGATGAAAALERNVAVGLGRQVVFYMLAMFAACMICHGEMVRLKPHPWYLTHFYLAVAAGGALGGILVALVAPRIFTGFWEYPIGLSACCLLAVFAVASDHAWLFYRWRPGLAVGLISACLLVVAVFLARDIVIDSGRVGSRLAAARNFYGVLRVFRTQREGGEMIEMHQGHIIHGDQFVDARRRDWPTMYYGRDSGVGVALARYPRGRNADGSAAAMRVGIIGMGAGTTAIYARKGDSYRFYEINPRVEQLARRYFSFLADSVGDISVVTGDARVMMERELDEKRGQKFDVLIVDAFTGDAIPIHLLTEECARVYFRELKPDGILAMHISNHFLDLEPVVDGLAASTRHRVEVFESPGDEENSGTEESKWMLITNNKAFLAMLGVRGATAAGVGERTIVWTDDFSSLWQVLGSDSR